VRVFLTGLSHSDISGSKRICRSPKLFAAYHVLLRLLAPRHPSCALCSLINLILTPGVLTPEMWESLSFLFYSLFYVPLACLYRHPFPISIGRSTSSKSTLKVILFLSLTLMCSCQRTGLRLLRGCQSGSVYLRLLVELNCFSSPSPLHRWLTNNRKTELCTAVSSLVSLKCLSATSGTAWYFQSDRSLSLYFSSRPMLVWFRAS
jgi:hypothetical protein